MRDLGEGVWGVGEGGGKGRGEGGFSLKHTIFTLSIGTDSTEQTSDAAEHGI